MSVKHKIVAKTKPKKVSKAKATKSKKKSKEVAVIQRTASKTASGITLQQEEFCQAFVGADRELFGNGVQSYMSVFGKTFKAKYKRPLSYDSARVEASKLLTKPNIIARVNELLDAGGFNDENVDKQLLFVINQQADFRSKVQAIKEYNQLRKRVDGNKTFIVTGNNINFGDFSKPSRQ